MIIIAPPVVTLARILIMIATIMPIVIVIVIFAFALVALAPVLIIFATVVPIMIVMVIIVIVVSFVGLRLLETEHAAIMVAAWRLTRVGLKRPQSDEVEIERQRLARLIPDESVDPVAQRRGRAGREKGVGVTHLAQDGGICAGAALRPVKIDRKSTRLNSSHRT